MPLTACSQMSPPRQPNAAPFPARPNPLPHARLGSLPEWNLADLYSGIDDPQVKRDLDRADAESVAFEEAYKGKLAALADGTDAGRGARRGGEALTRRSTIFSAGSRRMPGSFMPATPSIPRAQSFMPTCRSASRRPPRIFCFSCSSSIGSRTPSSMPRCRIRRSAITGRGSKISARTSPISSRTASSSSFTRSRSRPIRPGTGCSTRPSRACASRSDRSRSPSSRRSISCRIRVRRRARRPRKRSPRPSRKICGPLR